MKKIIFLLVSLFQLSLVFYGFAEESVQHTVVPGDSMWKIAVKYEVGLSEIKNANKQIVNPDLIYPGQVLNIPKTDETVVNYENEVVRLVNEIRVKNG